MRSSFFLFLFLIFTTVLMGQNDPLLRVELDTRSDEAGYRVIPCGENGVVLFYRTTVKQEDYNFWIFILYNKFMFESWKKDVPLFDDMTYTYGHKLIGDDLYLIFYNPDKKKSDNYNFQILKISTTDGRYELFSGLLPVKAKVASFEVYGKNALIGMNLENNHAGLYVFNLDTKEIKTQTEYPDDKTRIEDIYIDTSGNRMLALFNIFSSRSDFYFRMNSYDTSGNLSGSVRIDAEPGKKLNTGRLVTLNNGRTFIFGSYDLIKGESVDAQNYFNKQASGFFVTSLGDNLTTQTRYENFLDLENMTGYLKSREYLQARKKAEKSDGKESVSLGFDLLIHDIIEHDSTLYFIGEGYYESYHSVTTTSYDFYGRPVPVSYDVFDGYRYFNAFVSGYDYNGNKLWDNGMEIFNILSFDLKKRISIFFEDGMTVLAYNHDGKISSKIINGSKTVEGVNYYPIETTYVNDKVISDTKSDMDYWYDNYFIAYGFETIKNNSLGSDSKRMVFYLNKVGFE